MTVGYNSAVKTGMTALEELTENFPNIVKDVLNHCSSELVLLWSLGTKRVAKQATPLRIKVRHKGHFLPSFTKNRIDTAMAGISTIPDNI